MPRIEDLRFSSSSIDAFFGPPKKFASSNRVRIASVSQLSGFLRVADDKLIRLSQKDFWKLGEDGDGFFIERLVDDDQGPVEGLNEPTAP